MAVLKILEISSKLKILYNKWMEEKMIFLTQEVWTIDNKLISGTKSPDATEAVLQ